METYTNITYEVINPFTQKTEFETEDRYIALDRYEKGYNVEERHTTVTALSSSDRTKLHVISCWRDRDAP
jgi:hypothetical protein